MRVDVIMPQMGESIAEGTITRWIKQVGDTVERDDPIFEISTDKVDAEIPAPAAGKLVEIKSQEGDTVPVNDVVAFIETDADAAADAAPAGDGGDAKDAAKEAPKDEPEAAAPAARKQKSAAGTGEKKPGVFVSPVVRRIADEHGIDPTEVAGTGAGGRVTKKDILAHVESGASAKGAPAASSARPAPAPLAPPAPTFAPGSREVREPMTMMRKKIAEHMVESRRTSAHVHSVFEIDLTNVAKLRAKHKDAFLERHGVKLTFMPFIIRAVCDALRDWPIVNSSIEGETIVYKKDLNIGIAVALEAGLIVPVIRNAEDLSIAGLAKRVFDLADRARTKKLNPDEVQGGTFTITNPGQFGGLYGLPIINQPQVAILGVGGIEKRPVVIDDAIAVRSMVYMALSYDHRVVDGAVADQFLAQVKRTLQEFDASVL